MAIKPGEAPTTDLAADQIGDQATLPPESSDLASAEGLDTQLTLGHAVLIALVVGIFSVVWLVTYTQVNELIWENSFVAANRWMIPVLAVFFSLLVGLAQKYLHAPNVIREGAPEALAAGDYSGYKTFWGALCSSFVSLFSGASIGPEGPLGVLAIDVSEWLAIRLRLARDDMLPAGLAGVSAAYNGIVGSPIFSAVFASEQPTGKLRRHLLAANLVAGAVGFLLFTLLKVPPFSGFLDLAEEDVLTLGWIVWALGLGVLGAFIAAYIGVAFQVFGTLMRRFDDRVIVRSLIAGVIVGMIIYDALSKNDFSALVSEFPIPHLFLVGTRAVELKRRFKIELVKETDSEVWLQFFPRWTQDSASFLKVKLILSADEYKPMAINVIDATGAETVHVFSVHIRGAGFLHSSPLDRPDLTGYRPLSIDGK
jgi:hypothetical protein